MTVDHETLAAAACEADLAASAIKPRYSGRGMYGRECLAIVHDTLGELLAFVVAVEAADPGAGWICSDVRQDAFGLGTITYWPSVSVEGVPEEALDD